MIGNPPFDTVGLGSLPYVAFFEGLGPLIEDGGYVITVAAAALGFLNWQYCGMMVAVSVLFGAAVTLLAVLLNDVTSRQYVQGRDLALLVAVAVLESFGYRQLNALWGCVGTVQAMTGKGGWGSMNARRSGPDPLAASRFADRSAVAEQRREQDDHHRRPRGVHR